MRNPGPVGPGVLDITLATWDGYSTSGGLGVGLPGVRRLMDEFDITSEFGKGTTVTIRRWRRSPGVFERASVNPPALLLITQTPVLLSQAKGDATWPGISKVSIKALSDVIREVEAAENIPRRADSRTGQRWTRGSRAS